MLGRMILTSPPFIRPRSVRPCRRHRQRRKPGVAGAVPVRVALSVLVLWLAAARIDAQGPSTVDGAWAVTVDVYGTPAHDRLVLKSDAGKLTGTDGQSQLEGTIEGERIHFTSKSDQSSDEYTGTVSGDTMSGTVVHTDKDDPAPQT